MKTKLFCNLHPVLLDFYCVNAVKIDLYFVNYKKKILSTTLCLNKNSIEEFKKIGHRNIKIDTVLLSKTIINQLKFMV